MVITRSQAGSRQPLDPAASLSRHTLPSEWVDTQTSSIPQQPSSEGGVRYNTRTVGGGPTISTAAGNEEPRTVRHCRSDCMTCPSLIRTSSINSYSTGRTYSVRDIEPTMVHCKLQNYVYMLTCLSCGVQYVGESVVCVNKRMNIYRRGKSGCEILIDHFTNVCSAASFSIHILEKLPGNGYTNGSVD